MEAFSRTDAPRSTPHDPAPLAAEPARTNAGAGVILFLKPLKRGAPSMAMH